MCVVCFLCCAYLAVIVRQAVRDASKLPEYERRKKLNALRLKWHPDKHEVLREMAEEVRATIGTTVDTTVDATVVDHIIYHHPLTPSIVTSSIISNSRLLFVLFAAR